MKRITSVMYIFLMVVIFSCGKTPVDTPKELPKKFPVPTWKADDTGKYPATMTAVLNLPAALSTDALDNDLLAAFVNGECRGVGVVVKYNNANLYFVLIQGFNDETNKVTFKYYSNKTSYMFESQSSINFLADDIFGTAENPKTLVYTQLK